MTSYAEKFNENATMPFRVNKKQRLENYHKIWGKVEKLLRIDFESKPVYGVLLLPFYTVNKFLLDKHSHIYKNR